MTPRRAAGTDGAAGDTLPAAPSAPGHGRTSARKSEEHVLGDSQRFFSTAAPSAPGHGRTSARKSEEYR